MPNYAKEHAERAQGKYVARYNLRAREKSFEIGDQVLIITPDSTSSKLFSKWTGPAVIKDKVSAHSYLVDMNGAVKHLHADKLRKYHINVDASVTPVLSDHSPPFTTIHSIT